jgi:hypothetical protein
MIGENRATRTGYPNRGGKMRVLTDRPSWALGFALAITIVLAIVLMLDHYFSRVLEADHKPGHTFGTANKTAPAAPTNLSATSVSNSQIDLKWTDKVTNEAAYVVERSTNGSTWTVLTSTLATNTTSYRTSGLSASTTYYFRVKATNSFGSSPYSNVANATTTALTTTSSPVLVGAGDIATPSAQNDEATAKLLDGIPGTVYTLGDNTYPDGAPSEFTNYYGPTWGRHKARTKPSVGDHEYITSGASGYFGYFGAAAGKPSEGYYSYNLGEWHVVVLNSNCTKVGGCGSTSPMVTWLKNDLAANPRKCTLSYFHHPLFSSGGEHGNISSVRPIWDALYAANADVVLNGNDHNYERFAPQAPSGVADSARGIREFVVGTGGGGLYSFGTIKANSQVRNNTTHGVLKLTLHSSSYTWKFVPVAGKSFTDSGTTTCH